MSSDKVIKTQAIVIRTADFKESDRMLTLLTKDHGLMSAKVRAAKKQTSKLMSSSSLFCCGEYEFFEKGGYYGVRGCSIQHTFARLAEDYDAFSAACFIADAVGKVAQEEYPAPKLFALTVNALYALETGSARPGVVISYFIQRLLYIEGLYPSLDGCVLCGREADSYFSAENGGVVCADCAKLVSAKKTNGEAIKALMDMASILPKDIAKVNVSHDVEEQIKALLIKYLEHSLQKPLKTSKYLRADITQTRIIKASDG